MKNFLISYPGQVPKDERERIEREGNVVVVEGRTDAVRLIENPENELRSPFFLKSLERLVTENPSTKHEEFINLLWDVLKPVKE